MYLSIRENNDFQEMKFILYPKHIQINTDIGIRIIAIVKSLL